MMQGRVAMSGPDTWHEIPIINTLNKQEVRL